MPLKYDTSNAIQAVKIQGLGYNNMIPFLTSFWDDILHLIVSAAVCIYEGLESVGHV